MKVKQRDSLILLYGVFFLVFLQLLSDFVETIYAFGLLRTSLTAEIASIVLLFTPVVLLFARKGCSKVTLAFLASVILSARLVVVMLGPSGRMIVSGIGVGCWLVLLPMWLWSVARGFPPENERDEPAMILGLGLMMGEVLSIMFRTPDAGFDISMFDGFFSLVIVILGGGMMLQFAGEWCSAPQRTPAAVGFPRPRFGKVIGLSVGVISVLTFVYFALMSPNVIARWTGVGSPAIVSVLLPALGAWSLLWTTRPHWFTRLSRVGLLLLNLLFVLALTLTLLAHQIDFPADANAYPLAEPAVPLWGYFALWAMLLLSPVVFLDFILFLHELLALRPTLPQLGGGFAVGSLWLLGLILAQIFTTVYDYIPVVGLWFRDRFWVVFLAVGLGCTLPVLLLRRSRDERHLSPVDWRSPENASARFIWLVLCVATLGMAWRLAPHPPAAPPDTRTLRVMTYNIQQGYSADGVKNFAGQLAVLGEAAPDLIGLQESDTNRIAGGNADIVGYLAQELRMYSYYGPKTVPGTFGIALLSKYPIEAAETFYMYSLGEQTATIAAQIRVGEQRFNVFVTHLGNGGPLVQQTEILTRVRGQPNVILMGDFNFKPDSEQYRQTTVDLEDAWVVQAAPAAKRPDFDPQRRIDHIFVSPGTRVAEARYLISQNSDHPALWADISW